MKPNLYAVITTCILGLSASTLQAQPCIDNFSGGYPCQFVDQISQIPLEVFNAETGNDSWGWTSPITGREYVLFGLRNKAAFIDITSPEHPIYLGYLPTATNESLWRDLKVIGNYVFIVSEATDHGMQVFDLTRLENLASSAIPVVFNHDAYYTGFGNAHNIVADTANHFVYAVGSNTVDGGLHIMDVSNPLAPQFAGSGDQAGYVHDSHVVNYIGPDQDYQGKQVALSFNGDLMVIYDVTDKSDIQVISTTNYVNIGYVHQGWFSDNQRYALSNDETDELDFGINTRTIVWDLADLDNPIVLGYVDLGTTSIDHNLYIKGDMVFESNYTSGLRILDMMEVLDSGNPHLEPFGYFDVHPVDDQAVFSGTWSNYPYFESGIVAVSTFYTGIHFLRPNFFQLESEVLRICGESNAELPFAVNRRFNSAVNYSVSMSDWPGTPPTLNVSSSLGAPASNAVVFSNVSGVPSGYYTGRVIIEHANGQTVLPFVVVVENEEFDLPEILSPIDQTLDSQLVEFTFNDLNPGYFILEVALDQDFTEIVYQETFFGAVASVEAWMPFQATTYYWRMRKPTACGNDVVSPTASFIIEVVTGLRETKPAPGWTIYPNPAGDVFRISGLAGKASTVMIFDMSGRLIKQWYTQSNSFEGNVSELAPGSYIVRTSVDVGAHKLLINR